jgi:hypothetical protein
LAMVYLMKPELLEEEEVPFSIIASTAFLHPGSIKRQRSAIRMGFFIVFS